MTTRFSATLRHHNIARARVVPVGDDLAAAKRAASAEFCGDFRGYEIVILDRDAHNYDSEIVATRRVGARKWVDAL